MPVWWPGWSLLAPLGVPPAPGKPRPDSCHSRLCVLCVLLRLLADDAEVHNTKSIFGQRCAKRYAFRIALWLSRSLPGLGRSICRDSLRNAAAEGTEEEQPSDEDGRVNVERWTLKGREQVRMEQGASREPPGALWQRERGGGPRPTLRSAPVNP